MIILKKNPFWLFWQLYIVQSVKNSDWLTLHIWQRGKLIHKKTFFIESSICYVLYVYLQVNVHVCGKFMTDLPASKASKGGSLLLSRSYSVLLHCGSKYRTLPTKIATQTCTICREVWNLPHKFHIYLFIIRFSICIYLWKKRVTSYYNILEIWIYIFAVV